MKKIITLVLALLLLAGITVTYTVMANPGSDTDPIISFSYLKEIFKPEVKQELTFQVVSVKKGEKLEGKAGTELILRMGEAEIFATASGGLADITSGYDLPSGTAMPSNHLLIVPKDDGRGIKAANDCLVMVKGDYVIK